MNTYPLNFAGTALQALGSGALWWPDQALLCVSDLHLGKSERLARRGGSILPPYETRDTLTRLAADLDRTDARVVICLGDSFDDAGAALALAEEDRLWIARLQAGRRWIWVEGNHAQVRTRARTISRPAFLADRCRIILPAYGTYTGGLRSRDAALAELMRPEAVAVLTGPTPQAVPMPR